MADCIGPADLPPAIAGPTLRVVQNVVERFLLLRRTRPSGLVR